MDANAPNAAEGQAPADSGQVAPNAAEGQAEATQGTSQPAPGVEHFFDPKELPKELEPHYKSMQAAFTKKMQSLSESAKQNKQKLEAYDSFMRDPISAMQQTAARYGYKLSRAEAAAEVARQDAHLSQFSGEDGTPASWDEVISVAEERARQRVLRELGPYLDQIKTQSAVQVEKEFESLDSTYGLPPGSWRQYEDKMSELLAEHPSLHKNPKILYKLAIPEEVFISQATQKTLSAFDKKVKSAQIGTQSSVRSAKPQEKEVKNFNDAYELAKLKLAGSGG